MNLHTTNAVLAVDQHPESGHPFIHSERRIFEDRVDLERELLIAATAEPQLAGLNEVVRFGTATGADDLAIRPAEFHGVVESALRIGEVNYGLL